MVRRLARSDRQPGPGGIAVGWIGDHWIGGRSPGAGPVGD